MAVALVASPANPTGTILSRDELASLSAAIKARNGHLVVAEQDQPHVLICKGAVEEVLSVRKVKDPIMLKLPVFGSLLQKVAVARFARNFSNMIGAGVPILQALKIVGETSGNWVIENALNEVAESVRQGQSISGPLLAQPVFPAMVTQMIAVGEDAGSLEVMLDKIADFYDEEVQTATEQLTAAIEPLMIAFLGVVIGGMVIALYMPIFSIAGAVK